MMATPRCLLIVYDNASVPLRRRRTKSESALRPNLHPAFNRIGRSEWRGLEVSWVFREVPKYHPFTYRSLFGVCHSLSGL